MDKQELIEFAIELLQTGKARENDLIEFTVELLEVGKVKEFNEFRKKYPALKEIDLSMTDLRDINMDGANLNGVNLSRADLRGAIFDKQQIAMLPELLGIKVIEDKKWVKQ